MEIALQHQHTQFELSNSVTLPSTLVCIDDNVANLTNVNDIIDIHCRQKIYDAINNKGKKILVISVLLMHSPLSQDSIQVLKCVVLGQLTLAILQPALQCICSVLFLSFFHLKVQEILCDFHSLNNVDDHSLKKVGRE